MSLDRCDRTVPIAIMDRRSMGFVLHRLGVTRSGDQMA
jgi:hypothetical protein